MALSFARAVTDDKAIVKKAKSSVKRTSINGSSISARINALIDSTNQKLGMYKDKYSVITDEDTLKSYIDKILENGIAAIDTETTGLNTFTDEIVGIPIYTPGMKPAYIPLNHKSYITNQRLDNQLDVEVVAKYFEDVKEDKVKWVYHNAPFDIMFIRHNLGLNLVCYWDTQIAANCINENEDHRLKVLYAKYCDGKNSYNFNELFNDITFDKIPIDIAYLYAAGDGIKTYELYEYQLGVLSSRTMQGPYKVFREIEMPTIDVVCNMQDRGVCLDKDVCDKLKNKYDKILQEKTEQVKTELNKYKDSIDLYRKTHPGNKLDNPINVSSSSQLAILFYDIFNLTSPDKKKKRGTDEEILTTFARLGEYPELCQAILDLRGVNKLLSTYIDKMPEVALDDGRVHCKFNQYGAKTGRFSSSDPNLQNIPSHNKDIRQMFKAQDGYCLISGDYSQQEPRLTAFMSNDEKMRKAYADGKDIYATIASVAYDLPYEDCKEFRPDGTTNPEGKERRSAAKAIVLGVTYGKGIKSIGEDLGISTDKAKEVYNKVMTSFPRLKSFMEESQEQAENFGYVETAWGRRRHLPDMQLSPYEFSYADDNSKFFDPLSFEEVSKEVPSSVKNRITKKLNKIWGLDEKRKFMAKVKDEDGIIIKDNTYKIMQASRQCVNSRIQGGAADMAKLALISIDTDPIMQKLGFRALIPVHDEIIGECPIENAKACAERLSKLMIDAPKGLVDIPMKVDTEITINWYGEILKVG